MRILLDTHALLWWLADERRLSQAQREAIESSMRSGERLGLSAICFWEIAKLLERGRLRLPEHRPNVLRMDPFFRVDRSGRIPAGRVRSVPGGTTT
jgi:PIN domain nuclease of toxin-antitoxin system